MFQSSTESEIIVLEEAVRTEGLPILTFWETVVAILSSQPAVAPATGTATRSVPKQSFYRPLPSAASHNRESLVRGGVPKVPFSQLPVSSWREPLSGLITLITFWPLENSAVLSI